MFFTIILAFTKEKMRHNSKENNTYIHKKWSNNELLYTYIASTLKKNI